MRRKVLLTGNLQDLGIAARRHLVLTHHKANHCSHGRHIGLEFDVVVVFEVFAYGRHDLGGLFVFLDAQGQVIDRCQELIERLVPALHHLCFVFDAQLKQF